MLNLSQGDCKCGALAFVAGADLSAASGKLARLSADGKAVLPETPEDITPYVLACGADTGYLCGVVPLSSGTNARVVLKGTCLPGDVLVSAGDGRVEKRTELTEGLAIGTAEEAGQEGQRVLLRPLGAAGGGAGQAGPQGPQGEPGPAGAAGPAGADGAAGVPGTEFLLDTASIMNLQPNPIGALIGLEGGMWNGSVPGMGATLSALVTGTRTVGGNTLLVCVLLWDVGAGTVMFCQLPVSLIATPFDPLAIGGYVCGVDDGSLTGRVVLSTGYDVSIFNYNMLRCVAIADGIATFRSHYNP